MNLDKHLEELVSQLKDFADSEDDSRQLKTYSLDQDVLTLNVAKQSDFNADFITVQPIESDVYFDPYTTNWANALLQVVSEAADYMILRGFDEVVFDVPRDLSDTYELELKYRFGYTEVEYQFATQRVWLYLDLTLV